MNGLRIRFIATFSIFLPILIFGQSVDQLVRFADEKYEQGLYELAAREYQRALFFGQKEQVGPLSITTGDCYFELGDYEKAENYYRFAASLVRGDSLKAEVMLKKAGSLLLMRKYQMALFDLFSLPQNLHPGAYTRQKTLLGVAYFGLADFDRAEKHFLAAIPAEDSLGRVEIVQLFDSKKLQRPNPNLAYWMSVIVPGTGQFYSGDVKNGLNSFVLSIGLAILTYEMALSQSILDALLTVFPWWQRYYIGGYNSARHIAERKRKENQAMIYRKVYETIQLRVYR